MTEHNYKAGDIVKFYDAETLKNVLEQYRSNASQTYKNSVISLHDRTVTIEAPYEGEAKSYMLDCSDPDMKKYSNYIYREYMFESYHVPEENDDVVPIYGMSYFK